MPCLIALFTFRVIQKKAKENHGDVHVDTRSTAMDNQTYAREDSFCKSTSYSLHIMRGTGGEALVMEVEQSTNEH